MLQESGFTEHGAEAEYLEFSRPPLPTERDTETCFTSGPTDTPLTVALVAPIDKACGIAEHARRLETGFGTHVNFRTYALSNLNRFSTTLSRRQRRATCVAIAKAANLSGCDVAHIHHEFSFFGADRAESLRTFAEVMRAMQMPVVLTLHTWPWNPSGAKDTRRKVGSFRDSDHEAGNLNPSRKSRRRSPARQHKPREKKLFFRKVREFFQMRRFVRALSKATAIVVHTKDTYQRLITAWPKAKEKTFIVPLPVEAETPTGRTPAKPKQHPEKWVVLPGFIGRHKGHKHALAALKHLPDEYRLVIAGGVHPADKHAQDQWNQVLADVDAEELQSRVMITGFLETAEERAEILSQADCFLLPYEEVGQSGSACLADALASMKPVITSDATVMFAYRGQVDTIYSSIAVHNRQPNDIAETIVRCVQASGDADALRTRHQKCVCDRFSLRKTVGRYRQIYAFASRTAPVRFWHWWAG